MNHLKEQTEHEFLENYDAGRFERLSVTVDMLIFTVVDVDETNYRRLPEKELKILLVKRGKHPFKGKWALPGGFVGINESLDDAAIRELKSETNVDDVYLEQLNTWGDTDRDPRTRVISVSYMALVDSSTFNVQAGDDASDAQWFSVSDSMKETKNETLNGHLLEQIIELHFSNGEEKIKAQLLITTEVNGRNKKVSRKIINNDGIAFDHATIVNYGLERLRNTLWSTNIAINLMPELFTLTELQQVYEIILGVKEVKEKGKANFRRKIESKVIETDDFKRDAGHRPSKLFRVNPQWEQKSIKKVDSGWT